MHASREMNDPIARTRPGEEGGLRYCGARGLYGQGPSCTAARLPPGRKGEENPWPPSTLRGAFASGDEAPSAPWPVGIRLAVQVRMSRHCAGGFRPIFVPEAAWTALRLQPVLGHSPGPWPFRMHAADWTAQPGGAAFPAAHASVGWCGTGLCSRPTARPTSQRGDRQPLPPTRKPRYRTTAGFGMRPFRMADTGPHAG